MLFDQTKHNLKLEKIKEKRKKSKLKKKIKKNQKNLFKKINIKKKFYNSPISRT